MGCSRFNRHFHWSRDILHTIGVDLQPDGVCFEKGPHDFRCDWGRVVDWAPPDHFRLAWQIGPRREPVADLLALDAHSYWSNTV